MSNSNPRRNKGRKKIEMKKMTNERNLQVTFSKRRSGLFKKASELCTLCGASVAIIVFSPGEKALSFGNPNVETVINRYQMGAPAQNYSGLGVMQFIEAHRNANVCELNAQLTQVNADLEIEKSHINELNKSRKEAQEQFWCATPIEDMTNAQLEQYKLALENLKTRVTSHVGNQVVIQGANSNPPPQFFGGGSSSNNPPPQFFGGGSSSNNPPLLPHQPPFPPLPQLFPVPPPQMLQNPPLMLPNQMFDGVPMMMSHPGFNNMGGYGPRGGFF